MNKMKQNETMRPKMDDTEKNIEILSKKFKKNIRSKSVTFSRTMKNKLREEMSHVHENGKRLIHGKA